MADTIYGKYYLKEPWGDPMNFKEFGAEVELAMGEEKEAHLITSNTLVYIPKNVPYCPLNFRRVDKPIMSGHIMPEPTYRSTVGGETPY